MTLNTIVCDFSHHLKRSISLYIYIFISILPLAKFSRQNGIHVSPSVMWDGLIANEVSSGWEQQDWVNFFASRVTI